MEIFGIGPLELILILIIALIVFGPDRLPQIGARLGRAMREMRQVTRQFSQEIEAARQAVEGPIKESGESLSEVSQPLKEVRDAASTLAQAVSNPNELIRQSVMKELASGGQEERAEATPSPTGLPQTPAAGPAEAGGPRPDQELSSTPQEVSILSSSDEAAGGADLAQVVAAPEPSASVAPAEPAFSYRAVAIETAEEGAESAPLAPEARMVAELAALATARRQEAAAAEPAAQTSASVEADKPVDVASPNAPSPVPPAGADPPPPSTLGEE